MPSSGPFVRIDHPFTLSKLVETKATVTKSTGAATPRTFTTTAISGHISYQRREGEQEALVRSDGGLEDVGTIRVHTEENLKQGDVVRVGTLAGTTFDYRIVSMESDHPTIYKLTGISRKTYTAERTAT